MSDSEIQSRVIGNFTENGVNKSVFKYPERLIESIILFDTVVVKHTLLSNLSNVVEMFGYEEVLSLIRSDAIEPSIRLGKIAKLNTGKPYLEYHFSTISFAEEEEKISKDIYGDFEGSYTEKKDVQRLIDEISSKLFLTPEESLAKLQEQFKKDLTLGYPHVKTAITKKSKDRFNAELSEEDIDIEVDCLGSSEYDGFTKYKVESNIPFLLNINLKKTHDLISKSLLGVAGLNERISEMRDFNAMSGAPYEDYPIFNRKLKFLQDQITPKAQVDRWHRVLELGDFPDLKEAVSTGNIDLSKVIEIRKTDEVKEFRSWLWSTDSLSDAEIRERASGFRSRIAQVLQGKASQTLRWIATTGVGIAEPVTGLTLGAIDEFIIDRLFPKSGAMMFLNRIYPSIFENS